MAAQPDESDDDNFLVATAHLWQEPLHTYTLQRHAVEQQLAADFHQNEYSRQFGTAARVTEMSKRRIDDVRVRREVRLGEMRLEEVARAGEEQAAALQAIADAERELLKEARAIKRNEDRTRKRQDELAAKEREVEAKKIRAEELRIEAINEEIRRAALTPEERAAEDIVLEEKLELERVAASARLAAKNLAKARGLEEDLASAAARGQRKRRKRESVGIKDEYSLDGTPEDDEFERGFASTSHYQHYDSSIYGTGIQHSRASSMSLSQTFGSDDEKEDLPSDAEMEGGNFAVGGSSTPFSADGMPVKASKGKAKAPESTEELERKIWLQISRREIPKVSGIETG